MNTEQDKVKALPRDQIEKIAGSCMETGRFYLFMAKIDMVLSAYDAEEKSEVGASQEELERDFYKRLDAKREALEREHLGDADKRTGIYAQSAPAAANAGGNVIAWQNTGDQNWIKVGGPAPDGENWLPLVRPTATSVAQQASGWVDVAALEVAKQLVQVLVCPPSLMGGTTQWTAQIQCLVADAIQASTSAAARQQPDWSQKERWYNEGYNDGKELAPRKPAATPALDEREALIAAIRSTGYVTWSQACEIAEAVAAMQSASKGEAK